MYYILYSYSGAGIVYPSGAPEFTPVFSGVRVTWSLVLYVCFVDRCLSFCTFSFGHCVVCSSSIYGFWLSLWYLQTLLTNCTPTYIHPFPKMWQNAVSIVELHMFRPAVFLVRNSKWSLRSNIVLDKTLLKPETWCNLNCQWMVIWNISYF